MHHRLLVVAVAMLLARVAGAATNEGVVRDADARPIPNVRVVLDVMTCGGAAQLREAWTDVEGAYRFSGLDPGPYDVSARLAGRACRRRG